MGAEGPLALLALLLYSYMFPPQWERECPMCTAFLDALDAQVEHLSQRLAVATAARSPAARLRGVAEARGWRRLRVVSSSECDYDFAYHAAGDDGTAWPACNVFVRDEDGVRHHWGTELLYVEREDQPRHVDMLWPLWNVLDLTPEGLGEDWYPALEYGPGRA